MAGGILFLGAAATAWFWQAGAQSAGTAEADKAVEAAGFDKQDRAAVEAIVRDYILKNPEIIPEAVEILQSRQNAELIKQVRPQLEKPFAGNAWAGNPKADVTIVEFSDFACPHCKSSTAVIKRLLDEDKNLRVVFRELPILSEASNDAALMALAAAKQDKYFAFHTGLFDTGRPSQSTINQAAKAAGLDLNKAAQVINSAEARQEIQNNIELARAIQASGTPAWVIGNETAVGAVGYDRLKELIAKARAAQN